jgi:hypothetical protein
VTDQSKLDRLNRIRAEADALEREIERDRLAKPVTAFVGDKVLEDGDRNVRIAAPPCTGAYDQPEIAIAVDGDGYYYTRLACIRTLDGRKIDRVVPFRLKKPPHGYWTLRGSSMSFGSRSSVEAWAKRLVTTFWPQYEGPACIEDDE